MSDLSVQQQKQLDNYLKQNPNISREKAIIQLFGEGTLSDSPDKGISVEKTPKGEMSLALQSGRRVVVKNGQISYYSADGEKLKPEYFEQQEGNIDIRPSGRYSISKNGKTNYYAADGTELNEKYYKQVELPDVKVKMSNGVTYNLNKSMENRIKNVLFSLKKIEDSNGFIGDSWDWAKNNVLPDSWVASSDEVRELQKKEQKLMAEFNSNLERRQELFKELTGKDWSDENLGKFLTGQIKLKSEQALAGYKEGQDMAVDVGADIVTGVVAVGTFTAATVSAPFSGGTSYAVAFALTTATSAALKPAIKYADAKSGGRNYTVDDLKYDTATGAFSGAIAPVTAGAGGAIGKTVATKLGVQAVKQVGKEVAEETAKGGLKQTVKTVLANPAGYEYVGGNFLKKGAAYASEMAADGALGGALDNSFRTAYSGGSLEETLAAAGEGAIGGAIMSPVIGGGMKVTGKGAQKILGKDNVHIDANDNKVDSKEAGTVIRVAEDSDINSRLAAANSREDFVAIRDEITNMPQSQERTLLFKTYLDKYKNWSKSQADVKMEYNPQNSIDARILEACSVNGVIDKKLVKIAEDLSAYAKLTAKDSSLLESTDITIANLIKLMKDLSPQTRQEVSDSVEKLFSNKHVRNGIVEELIDSCLEQNSNGDYIFNKNAYNQILALFETKNKMNPSESDFSYSLKVAEIAKSAVCYTYDKNGNLVKSFNDVNFNIAKLYSEYNKNAVHIDFRYMRDKDTDLIDISKLDENSRNYILENSPSDIKKYVNKLSDDVFDRNKIEQVFKNMGFSEREGRTGIFAPKELQEKVKDLMNYPRYGDIYFSETDFDDIVKMLNQGEHKDFWKNLSSEDLIVYCLRFKNLFSDFYTPPIVERMGGNKFWDQVIKNLETNNPSEDELYALSRYTGEASNEINAALTAKKNNKDSYRNYLKYADELSKLIDKHVVTEDIKLYMGDNYVERFASIKLSDGTLLTEVLENPLAFKNRSAEIDDLLKNKVINQERFMSTSMVEENYSHRFSKVNFDFTLKAGSKALFRNIYTNVNNHEIEMIVQKDSKIILKGIDWNTGHIIADVVTN